MLKINEDGTFYDWVDGGAFKQSGDNTYCIVGNNIIFDYEMFGKTGCYGYLVEKRDEHYSGMYRKFGQNVKRIKLTAVMTAGTITLRGREALSQTCQWHV